MKQKIEELEKSMTTKIQDQEQAHIPQPQKRAFSWSRHESVKKEQEITL